MFIWNSYIFVMVATSNSNSIHSLVLKRTNNLFNAIQKQSSVFFKNLICISFGIICESWVDKWRIANWREINGKTKTGTNNNMIKSLKFSVFRMAALQAAKWSFDSILPILWVKIKMLRWDYIVLNMGNWFFFC